MDDGYSGTDYERPGFQNMLKEVEAGNVAIALTKDLSRLGRNSALTGLYTNFTFPQNGVRFIAIKLSDERFDMMSQSYEAEQKQLEAEVITLREEMSELMQKETA